MADGNESNAKTEPVLREIDLGEETMLFIDQAAEDERLLAKFGRLVDFAKILEGEGLDAYIERQASAYEQEEQKLAIEVAGRAITIGWVGIDSLGASLKGIVHPVGSKYFPPEDNHLLRSIHAGLIPRNQAIELVKSGGLVLERKISNDLIGNGNRLAFLLDQSLSQKLAEHRAVMVDLILGRKKIEGLPLLERAKLAVPLGSLKLAMNFLPPDAQEALVKAEVAKLITPRSIGSTMDLTTARIRELISHMPDRINPFEYFATAVSILVIFEEIGVFPNMDFKQAIDNDEARFKQG